MPRDGSSNTRQNVLGIVAVQMVPRFKQMWEVVLRLCRRDVVFRPRHTYLTRWTRLLLSRVSSIITDSVLVWSQPI
jgi:hypothetical protein